jgi:hypothetical protein
MSVKSEAERMRKQAEALEEQDRRETARKVKDSALDLIGQMSVAELEQFIVRAVKKSISSGQL